MEFHIFSMSSPKLLIILAFMIFVNNLNCVESARSSYGETCSRTQKCDRKAWLSCYDGKCDCSKIEEMLYDREKGKCVTKSGERCKYGVEESGETSLVEITDCVSHAVCGDDGICNCESQYHEIFNGTCAKSKSFGEQCTEEDKCSKFEHLQCIDGSCQCREGESVYSVEEKQCVGVVHNMCIKNKCDKTSKCRNGICYCNEDHYEDTVKCLLRKGPLESCTKDAECISKDLFVLKCYNNTCNCQQGTVLSNVPKTEYVFEETDYGYSYYQGSPEYYKPKLQGVFKNLCAPLVGKNCRHGYCVTNAYCYVDPYRRLDEGKFSQGTCTCMESYSVAKDKASCGRKHSSQCSTNKDCLTNLVCLGGRCECPSQMSQIAGADDTFCVTKIGGWCTKEFPCVDNAFCDFLVDSNNEVGHCKCMDGFVRNKEGMCDIGYGNNCSYETTSCDKAAGLECLNQKCSCADIMQEYSETRKICLGRVGALCSKGPCVDNANCSSDNSDLPQMCSCNTDFKENTNLTCVEI